MVTLPSWPGIRPRGVPPYCNVIAAGTQYTLSEYAMLTYVGAMKVNGWSDDCRRAVVSELEDALNQPPQHGDGHNELIYTSRRFLFSILGGKNLIYEIHQVKTPPPP
jgi:hypothetical protein